MLLGWGIVNRVEGIIDHENLRVHPDVRDGDRRLGDVAFLGRAVLLVAAGWAVIRAGRPVAVSGRTPGEPFRYCQARVGSLF
jgi:uncharacterized membrane protein